MYSQGMEEKEELLEFFCLFCSRTRVADNEYLI